MLIRFLTSMTMLFSLIGLTACINDSSSGSGGPKGKLVIVGSDSSAAGKPSGLVSKSVLGGTPDFLAMEMYGVYVSENPDCSDPIEVQAFSEPVVEDMTASPTLFSGNLPPATYKCVMFDINDVLVFSPDKVAQDTHGVENCDKDKLYDFDILRAENNEAWYSIDTDDYVPGTGQIDKSSADRVSLIITTNLSKPVEGHENQMLLLLNPLVIAEGETTTARFVVDFTDLITTEADSKGGLHCWVDAPFMDFETL